MSQLAILVDTNLLWKHTLRNRLTDKIQSGDLTVYVPTLMHAERIRQIADTRGETFALNTIQQLVIASQFELLPLTVEDAEAVADVWLELKARGFAEQEWREHRLDILLCAIARSRGMLLVTDDQGTHLETVSRRMNTIELEQWLDTT